LKMNLNELTENSKTKLAQRALKEHYNVKVDLSRLDSKSTREMLGKVRSALKEARDSKKLHESHQSPAYLKMVMMEQMLASHYTSMKLGPHNIVVENEEVVQAQVILAANDMVDSLQKMLEQISKMKVEDLNAVVQGISREYGTAESEQFNQTVGEALGQLEQSISASKQSVQGALTQLTGEAPPNAEMGAELGGAEVGAELGAELGGPEGAELGAELGGEEGAELPELEPEEEFGPAGRERR
jgi:gas vesicle protein